MLLLPVPGCHDMLLCSPDNGRYMISHEALLRKGMVTPLRLQHTLQVMQEDIRSGMRTHTHIRGDEG